MLFWQYIKKAVRLEAKLRFSFPGKTFALGWKLNSNFSNHQRRAASQNNSKKFMTNVCLRYMRRAREVFFHLPYFFPRLASHEAKSAIFHIRIVKRPTTMKNTSNANGLSKHWKMMSIQKFNWICISFEALDISCKIKNQLEISERYCRIEGQKFNIVSGMPI